jgi:prepilin peptidase CpaA
MAIQWIIDLQWAVAAAQIALLLSAAWADVATRLIPDRICLSLVCVGIAGQIFDPLQLVASSIIAGILFAALLYLHSRQLIGGGDVKLLVGLAVGLPPREVIGFLTLTALAGGLLAFTQLTMRYLPKPRVAPAGALGLRRVYAVERWRILRRSPLPYAVAIGCGGIWTVLNHVANFGG